MTYEPNWDSLDAHDAPGWFRDGKFGVFVHYWPTNFDAENPPVPENYDPESWVDVADDAGAKYLVFTTKHHDGWCNWPSAYSDYDAGETAGATHEGHYGASETGDPYDVLTPLVEATRRRGIKVGFYYSWLDRTHPDYDEPRYVEEYAIPQVRELVERYDPDLLWGDGEWHHGSEFWKTPELLAWYLNRAAERGKDVTFNDRFGIDTRYEYMLETEGEWTEGFEDPGPYCDYWTPEHQVFDGVLAHPWETCTTIRDQWQWRENPKWRDPGDLIALLVDVVSKNGTLLLNFGPKPDGTVPVRAREIFGEIGDWLDVNGPAIYGTRPAREPDEDPAFVPQEPDDAESFEDLWPLLVEYLREESLRFTRSPTATYAIHLGWPGEELELPDLPVRDGADVELLGHDAPLDWERTSEGLTVSMPREQPCEHAYTVRIPEPLE